MLPEAPTRRETLQAQNRISVCFTDEDIKKIFVKHLQENGCEAYAKMLKDSCWTCGLYYDPSRASWILPLKEAYLEPGQCVRVGSCDENTNEFIPREYPTD